MRALVRMKDAFNDRPGLILFLFILAACVIRIFYCLDLPLSGDEVGVGVKQAVGQSLHYTGTDHREVLSLAQYAAMLDYDPAFGLKDTIDSLVYEGMHPPFYYIVLRYVIAIFGNDQFTLRMLSLVFSLATIWFGYLLGRELGGVKVGLGLAFILAISAYTTKFGVMVRPYPLVGLLSVASTYMAIKITTDIARQNRYIATYTILTVIGFYSLYHYAFIILFQSVFFAIKIVSGWIGGIRPVYAGRILGSFFVIAVLCACWLPSLFEQMKAVNHGDYYFNKPENFISTMRLIFMNGPLGAFPEYIPLIIRRIFRIPCFAITVWGFIVLVKKQRAFCLATVAYFIIYFVGEQVRTMNTLIIPKFYFWVIPCISLFFVIGLLNVKRKLIVPLLFFFAGIILVNLHIELTGGKVYDGPDLTVPVETISDNIGTTGKSLIITNSSIMRYFCSLVHALKDKPGDIMLTVRRPVELGNFPVSDIIREYDRVFVVNDETENSAQYSEADIKKIVAGSDMQQVLRRVYATSGEVYLFERQ